MNKKPFSYLLFGHLVPFILFFLFFFFFLRQDHESCWQGCPVPPPPPPQPVASPSPVRGLAVPRVGWVPRPLYKVMLLHLGLHHPPGTPRPPVPPIVPSIQHWGGAHYPTQHLPPEWKGPCIISSSKRGGRSTLCTLKDPCPGHLQPCWQSIPVGGAMGVLGGSAGLLEGDTHTEGGVYECHQQLLPHLPQGGHRGQAGGGYPPPAPHHHHPPPPQHPSLVF